MTFSYWHQPYLGSIILTVLPDGPSSNTVTALHCFLSCFLLTHCSRRWHNGLLTFTPSSLLRRSGQGEVSNMNLLFANCKLQYFFMQNAKIYSSFSIRFFIPHRWHCEEYPPMRLVAGQHAALSRYLTFPVTILTERHNNPRSYHSNIHPSSSHRYSRGWTTDIVPEIQRRDIIWASSVSL